MPQTGGRSGDSREVADTGPRLISEAKAARWPLGNGADDARVLTPVTEPGVERRRSEDAYQRM